MAVIDWTKTHLIPTNGLLAWHLYDSTSTSGNINDASGNGRHIVQVTDPPVLTSNAMNGRPGWFFDGTNNPLATASSADITAKHVFVLASATGPAFDLNRGLLSGKTSGDWLASESAGTDFFSFGADYNYRKSDVIYGDAEMESPMDGPELLEVVHATTGVITDGIQVGQQKDLDSGARKWKGYFFEQMIFDRELTQTERLRVMLYFNIKFGTWSKGIPLFFPTKDLLTDTGIVSYSRFDDVEPDFEEITTIWKYEDGLKDRNEIGPSAPMTWEVNFTVAESASTEGVSQGFAYREIFEAFNRAARRVNPCYFRDKWGELWENVYIQDYKSSHTAHKSWQHDISFTLEANTSSLLTAVTPAIEYLVEGDAFVIED